MANVNTPNDAGSDEQSMEEILQSIRRIIAEEEAETPADAAPAAADDVLELTDLVDESSSDTVMGDPLAAIDALMAEFDAPAAMPAVETPVVDPEPVVVPSPEPEDTASFGEESAHVATAMDLDSFLSVAPDEPLVSEQTAAAAAPSFRSIQELAHKAAQPKHPSLLFRSGTTVEDLILEALRPMLKDWLEMHLPATVERIVQREIHRIVESAGDL